MIELLITLYFLQIGFCILLLHIQSNPPDNTDPFQTKKQFLISTFIPFYWLYRIVKDLWTESNYHSLK